MRTVVLFLVFLSVCVLLALPQSSLAGVLVPGFNVSSTPADESQPAIDGDTVVWLEGDPDQGFTIHTRMLGAPSRAIAPAAEPSAGLDVSNGVVVWGDNRAGAHRVYCYDLVSDTEFPIPATASSMQLFPSVSGDIVVWAEDRGEASGVDIYGADISDRAAPQEFPICTAPGEQADPAVSGDVVVWADARASVSGVDIYGADISDPNAPQEFPICTAPGPQGEPAIDGDTVVWEDMRLPWPDPAGDLDVYGADIGDHGAPVEFPVCTGASNARLPAVSGDLVVWQDDRNAAEGGRPDVDIYAYSISRNLEIPAKIAPGIQRRPDISGSRAVWEALSFVSVGPEHPTGYTSDVRGATISGWQGSLRFAGERAWTREPLATVTAQATSWSGPVLDLRMMLSGGLWSDWTSAVPPTRTVDLGPSDGKKVLTVQFRDQASGTSPLVRAAIVLDRRGPSVAAYPAAAVRGGQATLHYRVNDSLSPRTLVSIAIWTGYRPPPASSRVVKRFAAVWRPTNRWLALSFVCELPPGAYHFTIGARDLAGNKAVRRGYERLTVR